MKKKIIAVSVGALLAFSVFAGCAESGDNAGEDGFSVDYTVERAPNVSFDSQDLGYADDSIVTDTFVISYPADDTLSASVAEDAPVTLSEPTSSEADGVKTDTYTVTATAAGDYAVTLTSGAETETLNYNVAEAYPSNPDLPALSGYGQSNGSRTGIANVHDPVVVEAEGAYYVFSTDNMGPSFGYQVRKSDDLIHWEYVGVAIEGHGNGSTAQGLYEAGNGALQEVYDVLSKDSNWDNVWTLWAPDVVPAADGGYWLYGCWTAAFGQGHSVIFQCYSESITGPYEYVDMLVYSYDGWTNGPNAIDPSIFYDTEGNMYMAYGSFNGGIYCLQLNAETGLRYDGHTGSEVLSGSSLTASERYGTRMVRSTSMEGPVVTYFEDVEVYEGDVSEYDSSASQYADLYYLMGSAGSLSSTYNMRSYYSTTPTQGYTSLLGSGANSGNRVSGSFSWRTGDGRLNPPYYDFAYPGHNDMLVTSSGKNILAYHNRQTFDSGNSNHYLFTSMFAFNSRGDLVMSPNRYAGETERKITAAEITGLSGGNYMYNLVTSDSYSGSTNGGYASTGLVLNADGTVTLNGVDAGEWLLYGDNYVYIELNGVKYYGAAMPAFIERENRGGITISCLSENGASTLFLNQTFAD